MMAAVRAMEASWDLVADCPAGAQAAEPVQQGIAGSVIRRCFLPLVAGGGPRADRAGRSADGLRLLGTRSGNSARPGVDQLVELPDHGVVRVGGEEYGHNGLGAEGNHLVAAGGIGATFHEQAATSGCWYMTAQTRPVRPK